MLKNREKTVHETRAVSPDYSSGDEEDDGSKKEGKALHEVQRGWVERVEDTTSHQKTQALHTGNRGKQGTWDKTQTQANSYCMSILTKRQVLQIKQQLVQY